jgi:hypothetical protein
MLRSGINTPLLANYSDPDVYLETLGRISIRGLRYGN